MFRSHVIALLCATTAFLTMACNSTKTDSDAGDAIVATVNGVAVTEAEVAVKLQQMGAHGQASGPEMRSRAIEEILDQELLYQKGKELGLDKETKFRNAVRLLELRMNEFKRSEMERQVRNTQVAAQVVVTQDEVKNYYDAHVREISTDVHIAAMRFPNEDEARAAANRIAGGTSFENMAGELGRKSANGKNSYWDMGYLHWNQIPMEWIDIVYGLKKGDVSDVLSSKRSGIFIVKVLETRRNENADFVRMSAGIMNRLRDLHVMQSYSSYVDTLKKNAKIVRMEEKGRAS